MDTLEGSQCDLPPLHWKGFSCSSWQTFLIFVGELLQCTTPCENPTLKVSMEILSHEYFGLYSS